MYSGSNGMTEIRSVDVATLSAVEDIKKLLHQDLLGVTPKSFAIKVPYENGTCHSKPSLLQKRALKSDSCLTPPLKDTMASP